jgi:hypothetical protein
LKSSTQTKKFRTAIYGTVAEEEKQQMRRYLLVILKDSDRQIMGASDTILQPEPYSKVNLAEE